MDDLTTNRSACSLLAALRAEGLQAAFTQTGGICAAIEVRLEGGHTLLITDAEDSLSWSRADHCGWGVGLYRPSSEFDDGPLRFEHDENGALAALLPLVRRVLRSTAAPQVDRP